VPFASGAGIVVAGGVADTTSPESGIQRDSPHVETRGERSRGKTPSPVLTVLQRQEGTAGMAHARRMLETVSKSEDKDDGEHVAI
jgi:hypothetical protein